MVRPATCPICGKPIGVATDPTQDFTPFCSDRCKRIDFFRWNDGKYAIVEPLDPNRLPQPGEVDDEELMGEE
jgi:hypothetical protein